LSPKAKHWFDSREKRIVARKANRQTQRDRGITFEYRIMPRKKEGQKCRYEVKQKRVNLPPLIYLSRRLGEN